MNTWGHVLKLAIFGESHGPAIGIVIGGLPPGIALDESLIAKDMQRRAPGQGPYATSRKEGDEVKVLSGLKDGRTTGAPLAGLIENNNQRSSDYKPMLRPGHADWTALLKYGGFADMTGGGHFSGRLTAPLVFAGSVARQVLSQGYGTEVYGRIKAIGGEDDGIDLTGKTEPDGNPDYQGLLERIAGKQFAAADPVEGDFQKTIAAAKAEGDSVGGIVEAVAFKVPPGLGEPFFGSVESRLSELLFSVPAVKGVEFGGGFALAGLKGSGANDSLRASGSVHAGDGIYTASNHNGGILGGISNGMPLIVRAAIKPTASIYQAQQSVDPLTGKNCELRIEGRHDPCIVPRAVPVVEACVCLALLDLAFEAARYEPFK
jgi:chorismate synthase